MYSRWYRSSWVSWRVSVSWYPAKAWPWFWSAWVYGWSRNHVHEQIRLPSPTYRSRAIGQTQIKRWSDSCWWLSRPRYLKPPCIAMNLISWVMNDCLPPIFGMARYSGTYGFTVEREEENNPTAVALWAVNVTKKYCFLSQTYILLLLSQQK